MFYKVASETIYEKKEGKGRKKRGNKRALEITKCVASR